MTNLTVGDLVISQKGRDKGSTLLTVRIENGFAWVADGKVRKTTKLKKKNVKHLQKVEVAGLTLVAMRIQSGQPVSNKKLIAQIKTATK